MVPELAEGTRKANIPDAFASDGDIYGTGKGKSVDNGLQSICVL